MNEDDSNFWQDVSLEIADKVGETISPFVGKRESGETVKMGADETPTKLIDLVAEEKVIEVLEGIGKPITLISEEIGKLKIGKGSSEVVFVVDPLDGTINAVKKIPAYGISVAVAETNDGSSESLTVDDIQMGVVKNFATGDVYQVLRERNALKNGEDVNPSSKKDVSSSSIGAYIYRAKMEKIDDLCRKVRRIRILGSVAIELCYVADGTYDVFLDIRGNLRIVDIAAAKLVLEEAGGIVTDQYGRPLKNKLNVIERTSIVAASNYNIHQEIIKLLEGS
jgi:myo-inositol-1(or 4)-monophosphatase